MHGGKDRRDGTDIAGTKILIHHNTFTNPKVRAIGIRGIPEEAARIYNNWFEQDEPGPEVIKPWPATPETKVFFYNNAFDRPNPVILNSTCSNKQRISWTGLTGSSGWFLVLPLAFNGSLMNSAQGLPAGFLAGHFR